MYNTDPVFNLTDHLYRRKYGEMIAALLNQFGRQNFEIIEEAVQEAFQRALEKWPAMRSPKNPQGWIYTVARNQVLETLRKIKADDKRHKHLHYDQEYIPTDKSNLDDMAKMLLLCCNLDISVKAQIYLTLKAACGFSIKEIARATSTAEETIKKTLSRAKEKISTQQENIFTGLNRKHINERFSMVIETIYALFNEGYAASSGEHQLRKGMAGEAIYLCDIFIKSRLSPGNVAAQLQALMALMLFHFARFETRSGESNQPILLQNQDRTKWDKNLITAAMQALKASQKAETVTFLHIEARIAAEHCCSPSFAETNWPFILELYDQLITLKNTMEVRLNRIIALKYVKGSKNALQELNSLTQTKIHSRVMSYLIHALRAQLLEDIGELEQSKSHWQQAKKHAPTSTDLNFTKEKLKKF